MADFTALKTAIQTYIKENGNEEITGEKLQEILLSVVTTLGDSAINDLVTALANEVAARQNADGTLQQNITNEATARGNADTSLGDRIDDEATARANGDTALSNRLGSSITAENTAADQIGAEAEARAAADTALQGLIDGITDKIKNGYVYAGIATPSSTPATGKVFYLALTAGTYTNFGNTIVSQGINILKYNGSAWSLDAFIGIDDELTPGSNNLPKSGNVLENIIKNGSAFDLSAYNAVDGVPATYADLDAALAALSLLPAVYKQPGMSIKFVRTYDNKYVQNMYLGTSTADADFANIDNWEKINLEKEVSQLDAEIGENNGVVCEGTYNKMSVIFTLADVNIGDMLYLEKSDGGNLIAFLDEAGNEISHNPSYPTEVQVPVGFTKAILDYGNSASSTIKVTNKSQVKYRLSKAEKYIDGILVYNINVFNNHPSAYSSKVDARTNVDAEIRRKGGIYTYLVSINSVNTWITEQFIEDSWGTSDVNFKTIAPISFAKNDTTKAVKINQGGEEVTEIKAVAFESQTLSEEQKTTARANIGSASSSTVESLTSVANNLSSKIGDNAGVVCDGTYAKNIILFTLEDVNIGDTLYLERSAGQNRVTFINANNVEIENVSVYPSTIQVPVGFAKAILDYGGSASSTIKVTDKSQIDYRVSKLETDVPAIEGNVDAKIAPLIEVATGQNITADLDITNIDDTNPPKTTYVGWDFQVGFYNSQDVSTVFYYAPEVVSNFVKVCPGATYQYNGYLDEKLAFYDENKKFVVKYDKSHYGNLVTGFNFTVPDGCYYARFGCKKDKLSDFSIIFKSKSIVSNNLTGGNKYSVLTKLSNEVGDVAWKSPSAYADVKCDLTKIDEIVKNGIEVVRAADTNIQPCFKYVRTVGDKYSIHLKVRMPSDVHDVEEVSQILKVDYQMNNANTVYRKSILLKKSKTTTIDTAPKFPVAKYNACIQIANGGTVSESIIPDGWTKDYLLGADAMSIRYTGDCSVAANQDIRLSIGSGTLRIYHGSNDTTIASFALSSYNSMVGLFQALETATQSGNALEDFEVKQLNIDLAISDIIECDVALVTQYDDGNSGTFYDAFPFYFTTKEKNRIYDIEYIVDETYENNNYHGTMAVIDGYAIGYNTYQASAKFINIPIVITIGDPDVQNNGVEILEFSFTDRAESVRPTIKAIGIEGLTNTIEQVGIKIPLHWFTGVINKLKSQGVEFVTMHEVKEYENGTRQFPANKNYCVVKYDDSGLINIIQTPELLDAQLRNHISPSCALMLKGTFSDEKKALMSAVQRGYDFEWHIHHVPSDDETLANKWVVYFDYNTWVTQYQASMDKFFDILGYYPDIWTFHACQGNYNICRFLKNHGFHACYAPFGDLNISPITRFNAVAHYVITQADYDNIDKMFTSHRIG